MLPELGQYGFHFQEKMALALTSRLGVEGSAELTAGGVASVSEGRSPH